MNWLAPDSKFMRAWSNLVDGVWINILMLVTSIPIDHHRCGPDCRP